MPSYLRFVVRDLDNDSGRRQGLFQAAAALRDQRQLSGSEAARLDELWDWFASNLDAPSRLSLSRRPHRQAQALSWFKSTATEHLGRMHELARILETHCVTVQILRSRRPGYVLYEDEHQIAAYPFAETIA